MKKILFRVLLLCAMATLINTTAFCSDISVISERSSGDITVSGNTGLENSEFVFVIITDKEQSDFYVNDIESKAYSVGQCTSNNIGDFELKLHLSEKYATGQYKCIATTTGKNVMKTLFDYYSPYDIKNAIKALNRYSTEDISDFISTFEKNAEIFGTSGTLYYESGFDKEKLAKIMIGVRPKDGFGNEQKFNELFYSVEYLIGLDKINSEDEADNFIIANYKKLNIDERYAKASKAVRKSLCKLIVSEDFAAPNELIKLVYDNLPVSEFVNAEYWNDYKELVKLYSDSIVLDNASIQKLNAVNKDNVYQDMYLHRNSFKTVEDIISAYKSAINSENAESGNKNNGGGGGSSGGSYDGAKKLATPYTPLEKTETAKDKEISKFTDLLGFSWAEEAINNLSNKKVISGYSDGTFKPANNITREEFVSMLVRLKGYSEKSDISHFTDISTDGWYYNALELGVGAKVVNGVSQNEFGLSRPITRQDIAVMVYRTMNENFVTGKTPNDIELVSDYAKEAVLALYSKGIINGDEKGNFRPNDFATRAETAKILNLLN